LNVTNYGASANQNTLEKSNKCEREEKERQREREGERFIGELN